MAYFYGSLGVLAYTRVYIEIKWGSSWCSRTDLVMIAWFISAVMLVLCVRSTESSNIVDLIWQWVSSSGAHSLTSSMIDKLHKWCYIPSGLCSVDLYQLVFSFVGWQENVERQNGGVTMIASAPTVEQGMKRWMSHACSECLCVICTVEEKEEE